MAKFINKWKLLLWSLAISIVVLGICSKSSPLYPMNDWVDVHCFFTMGKGMLNGQVLYRDLYEQKGPVLYFLFALVSLISDTSFIGVFLLEVATYTLFLYYGGKIMQLYCGERFVTYIAVAVLGIVPAVSPAFAHGGSVEQLCMGFMAYGLYSVLLCFQEKKPLSFGCGIANGVFAGMVFWIKFTMAGFHAGLCVSVALGYLLYVKDWRKLLQLIGGFLLGFFAVTAVVFLYFICTGAVKDLFTAYFYNNLFLYPSESELSKLQQIQDCLKWGLFYNGGIAALVYLGFSFLVLMIWKRPMDLICSLLCFAGLVSLTYWGGKGIMQGYVYYDYVLTLFTIFGLSGCCWAISQISWPWPLPDWKPYAAAPVLAAILILSGSLCFQNGRNVYLMNYEKEELPQYQFAQIINQKENPTLLNYGFLDGGFYYAADVLPNSRFFCTFNVAAPDMWESQWEMLREGQFDFVVTRSYTLPASYRKYELVDTADMIFEGIDFTYYLYRLKD